MRKIKVVVLLVQQLQHGFTKNAKVSPNLTVAQICVIFHFLQQTIYFMHVYSAYGTYVSLNGPIARNCGRLLRRSSEDLVHF